MPSGTTLSPPEFHGCRSGGESGDEILKCATYASKQVFEESVVLSRPCVSV